jgi:hypothetical protein
MRTAAGILAVGLLGIGGGAGGMMLATSHGGTRVSAAAAPTSTPPPCRAGEVAVRFDDARAAAGHGVAVFGLDNRSGHPCTTAGYPDVQLVDVHGSPLPVSSAHSGGMILAATASTAVTIPPSGSAYFGVEWSGVCRDQQAPVLASSVQVVLPGAASPVTVSGAPLGACGGAGMTVSPIEPARTALVP